MPTIKLDVPLVAQEKANCCWHTSAYMIWLYWQHVRIIMRTRSRCPMIFCSLRK